MFIGSLQALLHTLLVGPLAYFTLVALLRVSGKRTLAKWNAFDFIVTVAFGSILATALLSTDTSVVQAAFAFGLLIVLQYMVTWTSVRYARVEDIVKSKPTILVFRGEMQDRVMREERVSESEVRSALRSHGVARIEEVGALVLETDGSFSLLEEVDSPDSFGLGDASRRPGDK